MKIHTFRITPGQKLKTALLNYCQEKEISAATILGIVDGLSQVTLRMPGATITKQEIINLNEDMEIVSVEGTLETGDCHIHLAVSQKDSSVVGGHLKEGTVRITAEVTLIEMTDRTFSRELDSETKFKELVIKQKI